MCNFICHVSCYELQPRSGAPRRSLTDEAEKCRCEKGGSVWACMREITGNSVSEVSTAPPPQPQPTMHLSAPPLLWPLTRQAHAQITSSIASTHQCMKQMRAQPKTRACTCTTTHTPPHPPPPPTHKYTQTHIRTGRQPHNCAGAAD